MLTFLIKMIQTILKTKRKLANGNNLFLLKKQKQQKKCINKNKVNIWRWYEEDIQAYIFNE